MSSGVSGRPAGSPSTTAKSAGPWDSPAVRYVRATGRGVYRPHAAPRPRRGGPRGAGSPQAVVLLAPGSPPPGRLVARGHRLRPLQRAHDLGRVQELHALDRPEAARG